MISRPFSSASSLNWASISLIFMAVSWRTSSSTDLSKYSLACSWVSSEILSRVSRCFFRSSSAWAWVSLTFCSFLASSSSLRSKASVFLSRVVSFCSKRRSCLLSSARRSLTSRSYSVRVLWISSLASRSISFFRFSPERMASLMRRVASASAEPISRSATFFR